MFVDISIDWVPSDGSAKSKYMCIFYFTRGCQIVLQTYGASLFSSQPVTKYLFPQSPTSSWYHQNFYFHQFKRRKMQSHFDLRKGSSFCSSLFHFFQLAGTLMKITYNNFSDLNMLIFLELVRHDPLLKMIKVHILARCSICGSWINYL